MVLQKSLHAKNFEPGEWLIRFGYDDSLLDEIGLEIPVYLIHVSGHFGVANSKVLSITKLSAVLKNPLEGRIRRYSNSSEPSGLSRRRRFIPFKQWP